MPTLPAAPAACPSAAASSTGRERLACQGVDGAGSSRRRASAAATAGPSPPSAARVPTAPPSWTARRSSRTAVRRAAASSRPPSQPAARRPKVIGSACWSRVRPAARSARWRSASAAAASPGGVEIGEQRHRARAWRPASPRCRRRPGWSRRGGGPPRASSESRGRSWARSARTGVPSRAVPAPSASRSNSSPSPAAQARAISSAAARRRQADVRAAPPRAPPRSRASPAARRRRRDASADLRSAKKTVSPGPWRWMSRR